MSSHKSLEEKVNEHCMAEMEKEEIRKLVEKIVDVFEGYALLPREKTANDLNNLKNAKSTLFDLLIGNIYDP